MTAAIAPIASNGPAAAKAAGPSATPASPLSSAMAKHRQELGTLATTLPFFAYTACFLLAPTVIVIVGAFQDRSGNFTLANFNKMFEANTIAAFGTSILVSLASSLIGAVVGALAPTHWSLVPSRTACCVVWSPPSPPCLLSSAA